MHRDALAAFAFNVGLRTLPICIYALAAARSRSRLVRIASAAVAIGALALGLSNAEDYVGLMLLLAAACLYFTLAACLTHVARRCQIAVEVPALALLATCVALFLVLPSALFRGALLVPVVALGFDRALNAYSYLASTPEEPRSFGDAMFFLLVDPSLVYRERAVPLAAARVAPSLRRCLFGLLTLAFVEWLFLQTEHVSKYPHDALMLLTNYSAFCSVMVPLLLVQYLSVSGSASWQIGLLGLFALRVQERFDYPLLARTPSDFWQRWNRYVASWLRHHSFVPLLGSKLLRRCVPHMAWRGPIAIALTFVLSGLLHVVAPFVVYDRVDLRPLAAFVCFGSAIIALDLAVRIRPSLVKRLERRHALAARVFGTLATAHVVLLFGWYLLPALSGF